ncbi:hypothetical protein E3P99_03514 [Wallemia hederae]|uniref:aminodeoxychorismate synthase n=1 Tax=Wallemia hederae TaxID=1540922 RepID=A0A4T0FJQ6_9BASI|nr:hypothetical protein E3P99_03514 [Wallemia hederae]
MSIKLLVVDHHDSYTNNILKLLSGDVAAHIVNHDRLSSPRIIDSFDAVILSPGPGRSDNDNDFKLGAEIIKYTLSVHKPLLGICLGHQGIATTLSTQSQLLPVKSIRHGHRMRIKLADGRLFRGIPSDIHVVTYNSLTIADADNALAAASLSVTATEADDDTSVMALQHAHAPIYGLQFHPESVQSEYGAQIMSNFLEVCSEYKKDTLQIPRELIESSSIALQVEAPRIRRHAFTVTHRSVDLPVDTEHVFDRHVRGSGGLGSVWLDSARVIKGAENMSYLANPALAISYRLSDHSVTIQHGRTSKRVTIQLSFWDWFDRLQKVLESLTAHTRSDGFSVGWVTALGYELGKESLEGYSTCQTRLDHLRSSSAHNSVDALLLFCNKVLAFNHVDQVWVEHKLEPIESVDCDGLGVDEGMRYILEHLLESPSQSQSQSHPPLHPTTHTSSYRSAHTLQTYSRAIEEARHQIALGESYELCLTTRFTADAEGMDGDGYWEIYKRLRHSNPAPYAAFMDLPILDLAILSSSPERFMKMDDSGRIEMKPIKGTVERDGNDSEHDKQLAESLCSDEKEKAENLMIVDLIRSDLMAFCEPASVQVPHLMHIESFEKVHQLVSTIIGKRKAHVGVVDAIKRSFPPGSMTGSPKLRSVRILEVLEQSNRGFYSGCIGYIGVNGCADLSVVIRTIVYANGEMHIGAGGAITYPSVAHKEWEEVLTKARSVVGTQIET